MPVLLFPHVAYFLVKNFYPAKNPHTGRINYYEAGVKWVKSDLYDPVQREHAHNYYLTLCPWISQADRDKVASEWADIRHAREAKEAAAKKEAGELKKAEGEKRVEENKKAEEKKKAEDKKKAEEKKKAEDKKAQEQKAEAKKAEKKRKFDVMLEESEGVAMNIAKVEKKLKTTAKEKSKTWMDVVMGD